MTDYTFPRARWCGLVAAIAILAAACGGNKPPVVPTGNAPPDQFLFQRGDDAMKR